MSELKLNVPYYSQRDSTIRGQAHRMCYSSSCAMLLKFLHPTALPNIAAADDEYLKRLLRYGDTTSADAQIQALQSFGVKAAFKSNLTWCDVDRQLEKGIPVPIGILHHGPVSSPSGGGHWIIVIGRTADGSGYYVHDPYGNLDLIRGKYLSSNGKALTYSRKNLTPRWQARGALGWGIIAHK